MLKMMMKVFFPNDLNLLLNEVAAVLKKYNYVPLHNANNDYEFVEYVDFAKEPLQTQSINEERSVTNESELKVKKTRRRTNRISKTLEEKTLVGIVC